MEFKIENEISLPKHIMYIKKPGSIVPYWPEATGLDIVHRFTFKKVLIFIFHFFL